MSNDSNLFGSTLDDIFAEAVERAEAGEPIEAVVAAYPTVDQTELRELLLIVTGAHHLQQEPTPRLAPERRAANKRSFLAAAAQMRAENEEQEKTPPPVAPSKTQPKMRADLAPSLSDLLQNWMRGLGLAVQSALAPAGPRLAPLAMMLLAVLLSTFSFVSVAEAAVPGDFAYPVKQWIRYQELNLAAPENRDEVFVNIQKEVAEDVEKAAVKAARRKAPIQSEALLAFHGTVGNDLLIGELRVKPRYQPDVNSDQFEPMSFPALPGENQQVYLVYQIVPVIGENGEVGHEVQGISLTLPAEIPMPEAGTTPVPPTPTPAPGAPVCTPAYPSNWVPYSVKPGDTLSALAVRTNSSVGALQKSNCIVNANQIGVGQLLFVPMAPVATPTNTLAAPTPTNTLAATPTLTPQQPTLELTLTAISTVVTATPSISLPITPVVPLTTTVISTPIVTPTIGGTPAMTPTIGGTPAMTPTVSNTPAVTTTVVGDNDNRNGTELTPTLSISLTAIAAEATAAAPVATTVQTVTVSTTPLATAIDATPVPINTPTAATGAAITPTVSTPTPVIPTPIISTPTAQTPVAPTPVGPTPTTVMDSTPTASAPTSVTPPATTVAPSTAEATLPATTTAGGGGGAGSEPDTVKTALPTAAGEGPTATPKAVATQTSTAEESSANTPPATAAPPKATPLAMPTPTSTPLPQNKSPLPGGG
ncbi:MAG: LysM peptidoglycan-binding domain-containing protein [Caldilineaceae bacterium]